MKRLLGSPHEFMPDKDLRLFILLEIITPFVEQKAAEGVRLSAHVVYQFETQTIPGPYLERKGKAAEVQVTVVCRQHPSLPMQCLLAIEIVPIPTTEAGTKCPSYSLQGVLRKDAQGYYLTESRVQTLNQ